MGHFVAKLPRAKVRKVLSCCSFFLTYLDIDSLKMLLPHFWLHFHYPKISNLHFLKNTRKGLLVMTD